MFCGALEIHIGGTQPLNMQLDRSSNALVIPISPLSALCKSCSEAIINSSRILNRANSCMSTTWVGDGVSNYFLML